MIVALRITTGGLGCRAYVDGYCGRATLVLSSAAAGRVAAAAAGAGAAIVRRPALAQPTSNAARAAINVRIMILLLRLGVLASCNFSYLTSSTTNGCPTNSVLRSRRGVSVPTYIVNGTREPVTSIRNP